MLNTSFESGQTLPTDRQMASPPKQVFQTLKVDSGDNTIGAQLLQLDLGAQSFWQRWRNREQMRASQPWT